MDTHNKYTAVAHFVVNRYRNILQTKKIGFKIMDGRKNIDSLLCELSLFHLEDMHYPQTAKMVIESEIRNILQQPNEQ